MMSELRLHPKGNATGKTLISKQSLVRLCNFELLYGEAGGTALTDSSRTAGSRPRGLTESSSASAGAEGGGLTHGPFLGAAAPAVRTGSAETCPRIGGQGRLWTQTNI